MFKRFPEEFQLDLMDCGPASLKIIAKHYGRFYNLHFLRDLCGTTREEISVLNITNGAEKIGLKTRVVRCSIEEGFRILKKEGFDIEASELSQDKAIRKLCLMMLDMGCCQTRRLERLPL